MCLGLYAIIAVAFYSTPSDAIDSGGIGHHVVAAAKSAIQQS